MNRILFLLSLLFAMLLLSACQTTELELVTGNAQNKHPLRTSPVDAVSFIKPQALAQQAVSGNLFSNGGFEAGLDGWTGCEAGAITSSNNAYEGTSALNLNAANCFYRSAEVSAGQDLVLSCYTKILSGSGWTGMGLGFSNADWSTVGKAPTTIITSGDYTRYDISFTAPANSKYASMWLYSDNPVVIDNCTLLANETPPPPPTLTNGINLLNNGDFESLAANGSILEWTKGCGGIGATSRTSSGIQLSVKQGACVDQALSASDLATLSNQPYTFRCTVSNYSGYASMSIFLNGQVNTKVIPINSTDRTTYQIIEITGQADQLTNGFVSFYSEGTSYFSLRVDNCSLTATNSGGTPPGNVVMDLLGNGDFESTSPNSVPISPTRNGNIFNYWQTGCSRSVDITTGRNDIGATVTDGACLDTDVNVGMVNYGILPGRAYTLECYAKNTGGYASLSIFLGEQLAESVVIPESTDFKKVEIASFFPTDYASYRGRNFMSIYSESNLVIDDCSFKVVVD